MTVGGKIAIQIDSNERGSDRANGLILAAAKDPRFSEPCFSELSVDVEFSLEIEKTTCVEDSIGCQTFIKTHEKTKRYLVELKEPADYVSSVLGANGHLYQQYLSMAEAGQPCMILVLGSDREVHEAIADTLECRYRGKELGFQIASYEKRLIHFESSCEALGCPVERWAAMPYTRLLSRVATCLLGSASLMDYRPRPVEGEREIAALSILLGNGIGPAKAAAILEKFSLILEAKENPDPEAKSVYHELTDCTGIGSKLAERIRKRIEVVG